MFSASAFHIHGPRLSGPGDLLGLISFSSFMIAFSIMSMSSNTAKCISSAGIWQFRNGKSSSDTSIAAHPAFLKTKCLVLCFTFPFLLFIILVI